MKKEFLIKVESEEQKNCEGCVFEFIDNCDEYCPKVNTDKQETKHATQTK